MERQVKHVDDLVHSLTVHGNRVAGCIRHKRDVMVTFTREGEEDWHDWFLTTDQAEDLIKNLQRVLERNKEE